MPPHKEPEEPVTSARENRCRDSTPLGIGIALTGTDLVQLGIDPVDTDVVDVYIEDGELRLVPGEGEPVISKSPPPEGVKNEWLRRE